jgi:microcompartment protein CcmK/EutM
MILGRVVGNVTSTVNHPWCDGRKLMIVEREAPDGSVLPGYLIAVDSVGAGPGERVLVLDEGNGARQVVGSSDAPVRSVIVGIVDCADLS